MTPPAVNRFVFVAPVSRVTSNVIALRGSPGARCVPFVPFAPLLPFAPGAPLVPLVPFLPDLPAVPVVLHLIFFSVFLHFVFEVTMRSAPPFFFWQA